MSTDTSREEQYDAIMRDLRLNVLDGERTGDPYAAHRAFESAQRRLAALRSPSPSLEREAMRAWHTVQTAALQWAEENTTSRERGPITPESREYADSVVDAVDVLDRALTGEEAAPREAPECTNAWHYLTFADDGRDECPECGNHCRRAAPPVPEQGEEVERAD